MAAFTVTTASTAIALDAERRGIAAFTVTNQTGRSVRARASVSPLAPAPAAWFAVDGEAERLLLPGASESYMVRIAVPAGAGTGPRSFRLDVASVDRPDEEWAHGPAVGFDLADVDVPPRPGYVETVIGALGGAVGGIFLAAGTGALLWIASGLPLGGLAGFLPVLGGGVVAAVALGGAIGVFGSLTFSAIQRPAAWQTALAYAVAAVLLGTILGLIPVAGPPDRSLVVMQPETQPIVIVTQVPIRTFLVTQRPPQTVRPATPVPATPAPAPQALPVTPLLTVLLTLVAALIAALVARAGTRWQALGRI